MVSLGCSFEQNDVSSEPWNETPMGIKKQKVPVCRVFTEMSRDKWRQELEGGPCLGPWQLPVSVYCPLWALETPNFSDMPKNSLINSI